MVNGMGFCSVFMRMVLHSGVNVGCARHDKSDLTNHDKKGLDQDITMDTNDTIVRTAKIGNIKHYRGYSPVIDSVSIITPIHSHCKENRVAAMSLASETQWPR